MRPKTSHLLAVSVLVALAGSGTAAGAPANDACADAEPIIGLGCYPFTTVGATTDGPPHAACAAYGDDQVNQDVWFEWTAFFTGDALFTTCGTEYCAAADFDTKIAVYDGCGCPVSDGTLLGCNDDGAGCPNYTSALIVPVTYGQCYKVRVGGFGAAVGTGELAITPTQPANDYCFDAMVITEGCHPFNNLKATLDGDETSQCAPDTPHGADVWFQWSPSFTGNALISLCGLEPTVCPGTDFDAVLEVYDECLCYSGGPVACSRRSAGCEFHRPEVVLPVEQGQCYLIRVSGYDAFFYDSGSATLSVGQAPPPPCALECSPGAVVEPEPCGASLNNCDVDGSTMSPISSGQTVCGTLETDGGQADDDWYELFVPDLDGDGVTEIRATLTAETWAEVWIDGLIDAGDCPAAGSGVSDSQSAGPCETATAILTVSAPRTCSVRVYPLGTDGVPCSGGYYGNGYTLSIACDPPSNDECANPLFIEDGQFAFDTRGASTDGPTLPPGCDEGYGLSFVQDLWYLYGAGCTGQATVSLCGSTYDTRLAVYDGAGECPGALIACNDDSCGLQSELVFPTTQGGLYLVRVGGFNGSGTGSLAINCAPEATCPWDCGDGIVNVVDFLALLAQWGLAGSCDFDGGGVTVTDFLEMLANWGDC
jgi:hypothetical protein